MTTECPIAARYAARINAVVEDYKLRGIQFEGLFPQAYESKKQVESVIKARKHAFAWSLDKGGRTAREFGVTTVPTVVVTDSEGRVVFFGGLDDHRDEPQVKRRYLREVLDALLAGKSPTVSETLVFGCTLQFEESAPRRGNVTYFNHILPVLQASCLKCHVPEGAAPFSLIGYERARRWYRMMRQTTEQGAMPPWGPVTEKTPWPHRLKPGFPQLLRQWNEAGFPVGDPPAESAQFRSSSDWTLGSPSILTKLPRAEVPANSGDSLTVHRWRPSLNEPLFLNGFEVLGANPRTTRRISVYLSRSAKFEETTWSDPPGQLDSWLGSWSPSEAPGRNSNGAGMWVSPGHELIVVWHRRGADVEMSDAPRLGLFAGSPVRARELKPVILNGPDFQLLPDEDMKPIRWTATVPQDWALVTVRPLMRYFGKSIVVTAELPDGRTETLCSALRWNFEWQPTVRHKPWLFLPKGTQIYVSSLQSNRAGILDNPDRQPITVRTGSKKNDAQCGVLLGVVEVNAFEAAILN